MMTVNRKLNDVYLLIFVLLLITTNAIASETPNMGMDSHGNIYAVWDEQTFHGYEVQASVLTGEVWSEPQKLSELSTSLNSPIISVNSHGDAVALWRGQNCSHHVHILYAAMLPAGQKTWTMPAQISSFHENVLKDYSLQTNDSGDVAALWSSYDANYNQYVRIATSHIRPVNEWSGPTTVSGP